jgi:hypothetical protein
MRFPWFILLYIFIPFTALAQNGIITGRVTRADFKTPLTLVNVFLSNTTSGTTTNSDGNFTLSGLKRGQYTLVVSIVGFQNYTKTVTVGSEPIKLDVELITKVNELKEVRIGGNANWARDYEMFVKDFIGTDDNAKYCVVENPHEVDLTYHKAKQLLEASTDDFLVVDNMALGYKVKFLIQSFSSDHINGEISYTGQRLFQELPGTKKQKAEWKIKREQAYFGSPMHFYRSLYTNTLDSQGFIMLKLIRMLNPGRASESVIQQRINMFNDGRHRDSVNYWVDQENMSKYYRQNLIKIPLAINSVLFRTQQAGIYAVSFTDCLYVIYTKKHEEKDFKDVYRPLDMDNFETSIATSANTYYFDSNGVVFGDTAPMYEGTWSKSRLSDLLPVDYAPEDAGPPPEKN